LRMLMISSLAHGWRVGAKPLRTFPRPERPAPDVLACSSKSTANRAWRYGFRRRQDCAFLFFRATNGEMSLT
jgi:hypothetical protein